MTGEKCYPPFKFFLNEFNAFTGFGGDFKAGITDSGIEIDEAVHIMKFLFIVCVYFIEDDLYRNTVCFGRSQKTVDKGGGCFRIVDRYDKHALVKVCSENMRLLGEIGSTTDNVIFPVFYFTDESSSFRIQNDLYIVSHSYRVGTANAF